MALRIRLVFCSLWGLSFWFSISVCDAGNTGITPIRNSRCSQAFPMGNGHCVHKLAPCPQGTVIYPEYSNYQHCNQINRKCCGPNPNPTRPTGWITPPTSTPSPTATMPPISRNCGRGSLVATDRIFNGIEAEQCDWPFLVSVRAIATGQSTLSYASTLHACAGVLIDARWVLTSPFCVLSAGNSVGEAPGRILVVAGEHNVSTIDIFPADGQQQEQLMRIERAIIHPDYRYASIDEISFDDPLAINGNAVALLKLTEPIVGRCAGIACLPLHSEADDQCQSFDECIAAGWGLTTEGAEGINDILRLARVRLSARNTCEFLTEFLQVTDNRPEGSICQTRMGRNTDTCLGDEGGAVLCNTDGRWVVRAIIPFNMCVDNNLNLFVTEVAPYLNWIQDSIQRFAR